MERSLESLNDTGQPRTWTPQRHHWWIGLTVFLLVAGATLWWDIQAGKHQVVPPVRTGDSSNTQAVPVAIQSIGQTLAPQWLDVTGTVQAEMEAPIAAKVMGRVQSVLVREGAHVYRGESLILLDARDLDAALAQSTANLRAASVNYDSARIAARMESSLSAARIAEAQAKVAQSAAALQAATAKLELVQAGPRRQEREQATLAVAQAKSNLVLAENNLKRMRNLYEEGAISAQQYDQYQSQYEVAKSQFETAQQGKSIVEEGSRAEEIRAAQEAVRQARATVQEARASLKSAQASALQAQVRKQEIAGAQAQIGQSQAGLQLARVNRDYAVIVAPFDGLVTKRLADPGAMASPGVPLLTIQGGTLRLEAIVPESALTSVRPGAAVPVQLDALRERSLSGHVVEIAPQGDASSHTFIVKIALPARSGAAAGMFGRARFPGSSEPRLLVPASAVFEREGLHYLYVVDANRIARLRMVTVGEPDGKQILLLSGVNAGENIIVSSRERIMDGSPVIEGTR